MNIIVYSGTSAGTVKSDLGKADYSYYFILEKYLPILHKLGEVKFVDDPLSEVDEIYAQVLAAGGRAVFLSFSPPHNTVRTLNCPTVCVMAWEFESIPDEDWDTGGPSLNWVSALRDIGNVITISDYATRVISRQVGRGVRVVTVPAPVDAYHPGGNAIGDHAEPPRLDKTGGLVGLELMATLVDSRECDIDVERVTIRNFQSDSSAALGGVWDGREVDWAFVSSGDSSGEYQYLVGFYGEEDWGCWSRTANPGIILPWQVHGDFEIELSLVGYGENQGRSIDVRIGDCTRSVVLSDAMTSFKLQYSLAEGANSIHFSGLISVPLPGARDHRTLGLGLSNMALRPMGDRKPEQTAAAGQPDESASNKVCLQLDGTVYTSVFNPEDGRKNWKDIVTAFCWAFRDDSSKTLLLKMSHHNKSVFMGDLLLLFSKLHPFSCRIVAIHGFLSVGELQGLVAATDFYVNASGAEGQCLPLLEFMVEGIPAIAPDHTAMETYINDENAFIVSYSLEPQTWLVDPRRAYRTTTQRISWDSLRRCFIESARLLESDTGRYAEMSKAAAGSVARQYSSDKVARDLARFLDSVANARNS